MPYSYKRNNYFYYSHTSYPFILSSSCLSSSLPLSRPHWRICWTTSLPPRIRIGVCTLAKTYFCGRGPQKYEWGHHGFCRVASPYSRTIYLLLAHVRRFEERTVTQESRLFGRLSLLSPSPWERDGVRLLLLHQELHNHFGAICNRGAGTEDGGNTGFVEEKRS